MADADDEAELEEDGEEGEGAGKGSKKKLIIMIAAGVLLLGGGGAGAYFMGLFGGSEPAVSADGTPVKQPEVKNHIFSLPEVVVKLNSSGASAQYMKVTIALEVKDPAYEEEIKKLLPRVQDSFQVYMRELRPTDFEGSAGLIRLREELMRRINLSVFPSKVEAVLFKELILQ